LVFLKKKNTFICRILFFSYNKFEIYIYTHTHINIENLTARPNKRTHYRGWTWTYISKCIVGASKIQTPYLGNHSKNRLAAFKNHVEKLKKKKKKKKKRKEKGGPGSIASSTFRSQRVPAIIESA